MLLMPKVKQVFKLIKVKKNGCYSCCDFPIYVNGCPKSNILSLKYSHLELLIQTSPFYTGSWHKFLKSKHYCFFNITLPWIKIWTWQCSRYLRNQGFLPCEKLKCLKFRYTEVIHKKLFSSFLEMHNLWICRLKSFNIFGKKRYGVWFCFISIAWVHFSHKTDTFLFLKSLKYFNFVDKKYFRHMFCQSVWFGLKQTCNLSKTWPLDFAKKWQFNSKK